MHATNIVPSLLISSLPGFVSATSPNLNLFAYGNPGPLLGTSFGIPSANATFDYVVVGGGNAGLTIASRLAQNQTVSVAVVEAGGFYETDNGNYSVVPGYSSYYTGSDPTDYQPLVDWGFSTQPQPGSGGRVLHYARGKTLGGSSARNYMLYQRPTVDSMQRWADEVDDQSYTFENLLPYFKKSVHYTPPNQALYSNSTNSQTPNAFSPTGGPLEVSFSNAVHALGSWCQKAFIALGMKQIDGFNSGELLGSAFATFTIDPRNAHRSSSESSFLQAALNKSVAPTVYKNTMAQKILFDRNNKRATGVQVSTEGTFGTQSVNFTLHARNQVILSAGAFQSPQLLMVSGIGPCDDLRSFDIPCIKNLPGVGQNMQDHPVFGTSHRVNVLTASASANNTTLAALSSKQYIQNATGPLSITGAGYYGWEKLPNPFRSNLTRKSRLTLSSFPSDWPELEWLPIIAFNGYNLNKVTADPKDGHQYATLSGALIAPLSRGSVRLAGPSMNTPPLIDPRWLADPTDTDLVIQAFKRQRQIWAELAKLGVAEQEEYFPGFNVSTDEQILEFIQQSMTTVYHASATCKMGRKNDKMAVVDSHANVYGVQGLRVVDASSFPFLPPGHPQSIVYAFAEKTADEILDIVE
ncbi:Glucose-methanol-choline oxidoreductase [Penicillium mononematosum]|uniref:Glucose-methanol-choline oxidoreductase n=1 Tax=Penicillium mononematosum TaxID=268346 RepID=UPI002548BE6D|nr:Glucose-methanol-choline oxidoreductase [Penicillium mononematosum]KAJ6178543.1 Glucose-methanol-choline oxidoreductase [Penicillium mononematosum]